MAHGLGKPSLLDGTLLRNDNTISVEKLSAIEYIN